MSAIPPLEQPLRVSPLIRVGRWSLLGLGIFYGMTRHRTLHNREQKLREIRDCEKPAKDAAKKVEDAARYRREMLQLAQDTGTPVPVNF